MVKQLDHKNAIQKYVGITTQMHKKLSYRRETALQPV